MAVDPETGEEQTLLSHVVSGLNPAWSLDGSQLAFNVVTSRGFDIEVMSSDGDNRRSVLAVMRPRSDRAGPPMVSSSPITQTPAVRRSTPC